MSETLPGPTWETIDRLKLENARLSAILYSIIKHKGINWNLELKGAAQDDLPIEDGRFRVHIGYNIVGDDAIVTALFGSALKRYEIQTEAKK